MTLSNLLQMTLLRAGDWTGWFSDLSLITSYSMSLWILHCFLQNRFFLCLINTQTARRVKRHSCWLPRILPKQLLHLKILIHFLSPGMLLVSLSHIGAQAQWTSWGQIRDYVDLKAGIHGFLFCDIWYICHKTGLERTK